MSERLEVKPGWYRWRSVSSRDLPVFCTIKCSDQKLDQTLLVTPGRLNTRVVWLSADAVVEVLDYAQHLPVEPSGIEQSFQPISRIALLFVFAYRIKNVLPETQAASWFGFGRRLLTLARWAHVFEKCRLLYEKSFQYENNVNTDNVLSETYLVAPQNNSNYASVAILIPTRDRLDLLKPCIDSLLRTTKHLNVELLVIDNASSCPETLRYLKHIDCSGESIRVLRWPYVFNYSAINNFAASQTCADFLLFLNNDIEAVEPGWLEQMLAFSMQREVGCVGALLSYPSGRIQHAGLALGVGGIAGHLLRYLEPDHKRAKRLLNQPRKVAAVTGACMLVKHSLFEEVGGFDQDKLPVKYSDVDLCLKLLSKGYSNVIVPGSRMIHHESISRVNTLSSDIKRSPRAEENVMLRRWGHLIADDPYYPSNLSRIYEDLSKRVKIE